MVLYCVFIWFPKCKVAVWLKNINLMLENFSSKKWVLPGLTINILDLLFQQQIVAFFVAVAAEMEIGTSHRSEKDRL